MNKLPRKTRRLIHALFAEGMSMCAINQVVEVSFNVVKKLLIDTGIVREEYHNKMVRNVRCARVQCDEIWSFLYAKNNNVAHAMDVAREAENHWTCIARNADSKLNNSFLLGNPALEHVTAFLSDVPSRLVPEC